MRKINKKNKISFNLFGALVIVFLAAFAFVAVQVIGHSKETYAVAQGSAVYDEKMQPVDMTSNGTAIKKWNKKYYLTLENKESYCLGGDSVVYDTNRKQVSVLGNGYQVYGDGSVVNLTKKTEVPKDAEARLFKLEDRNYLLTGNSITCKEQGFSTSNYLQINIDKAGNALLTNDQVNMKTVKPMVLTCGHLVLDIANEQLLYDKEKIDLKAIGGSSNQYKATEESTEEETTEGSAGGNNSVNNNKSDNQQNIAVGGGGGSGSGNSGGSGSGGSGGSGSGGSGGTQPTTAVKNLDRSISLRGTSSDVTSILVEYSITDVENKFISTYLIVRKDGDDEDKAKRVELNKADTRVRVRNLNPNEQYEISLCYEMYMLVDGNSTLMEKTANVMKARTKSIEADVEITKMTSKSLYVTVTLDSNYVLDSADLDLRKDEDAVAISSIPVDVKKASKGGWSTEFDISHCDADEFHLVLSNAKYQGDRIVLDAEAVTKTGGITQLVTNILRSFGWV